MQGEFLCKISAGPVLGALQTLQESLRTGLETLRTGLETLRTEQISLRAGQESLRAGQESLRTGLEAVERCVEDRLPIIVLSKSPAQLGNEQLAFVNSNNLERTFAPTNGPPFLTPDEYKNALLIKDEGKLVEYICPKLDDLLPGRVVAVSQSDPWLESSKKFPQTNLKPDALAIHRAFLNEKQNEASHLRRGSPAHKSLYLGTVLIDFKLEKDSTAFGELVNHLQHLFVGAEPYNPKPFVVKGALAYKAGIDLVSMSNGNVFFLEHVSWTAGGSAGLLSSFFAEENPTALVLNEALKEMDLKLYDVNRCHNRFLGVGGSGSVFWVDSAQGGARRGMALKVVTGPSNTLRLKAEYENNQAVALRAADVIVKATKMVRCVENDGAGLLMEEVGNEVEASDVNLDRGLGALVSLHKSGFSHGDARRQNLLNCLGRFKWCDLQFAVDMTAQSDKKKEIKFSEDLSTFLKSFGKALQGNQLDRDLLNKYMSDISVENIRALVLKSVAAD